MIKRLIFDLDDTLIPFREEYVEKLYAIFLKYIDKKIPNLMDTIFLIATKYDEICEYYNKEDYLSLINKELKTSLPRVFIDEMLEIMKEFICEKDKKIVPILSYLSTKYELVILSNWFRDVQIERLKKLDVLKYFKEIYTCDTIKRKPYDESYMKAKGNFKPEECVMIGDSYIHDIKRAQELGFKTVYLSSEKEENLADYTIASLSELCDLF